MSADRLRQAAQVLRERAEAVLALDASPDDAVQNFIAFYGGRDESLGDHHVTDSHYIAMMHPGVGLALADWLEVVAHRGDEVSDSMPPLSSTIESVCRNTIDGWSESHRLADLILGEQS